MVASTAFSNPAAACSTPRNGSTVAVATVTETCSRADVGDVAALPPRCRHRCPHGLDGFQRLGSGLRAGAEHDATTPSRGHRLGEEESDATQTAGDDVGAVVPESPGLLGRYHNVGVPGAGQVEHELARVLCRAHHEDSRRRIAKRITLLSGTGN